MFTYIILKYCVYFLYIFTAFEYLNFLIFELFNYRILHFYIFWIFELFDFWIIWLLDFTFSHLLDTWTFRFLNNSTIWFYIFTSFGLFNFWILVFPLLISSKHVSQNVIWALGLCYSKVLGVLINAKIFVWRPIPSTTSFLCRTVGRWVEIWIQSLGILF